MIINMNPEYAFRFSFYQKKRIIEYEKIIITDPKWSYYYAKDVIKGRFDEAKHTIASDPLWAFWYAKDILCNPFEECHYVIFNSKYKNEYIGFLKSIGYDLNKISEWLI